MLPLQQAYEVQHSILEYLKATFSFKDKAVHEAFYKFVTDSEEGIFRGPYVSLKLPFVKAAQDEVIPLEIAPNFPPYDHQFKAFKRLTTQDNHKPQSTLVTTGTSSGKTECFLYPILDHCYKNRERKGIKVIILYPMNALATDQAKRIAETIWSDNRLKGRVTAGLFIGEGKDKKKFPAEMGENHVLENRQAIIDNPPDILLTNFKMLDYGLMRNSYHNLWTHNLDDSSLLRFLVLDELHTYDGAQGTDVANLIRRLKLKLGIPRGQLCSVGTSATIGSGAESILLLTQYAEKVFGENFDGDSIIAENRMKVEDFFDLPDNEMDQFIPRQIGLLDSRMGEQESYEHYIIRQKRLWQIPESIDKLQLGVELKKLKLMKDLLTLTGRNIIKLDTLLHELADLNVDFRRLPEWVEESSMNPREEVINSLLALINEARIGDDKKIPFLYLQIQIWVREMSGVLREIGANPRFTWKDKVGDKYDPRALPAYYCRECGASGWLGIKDDNKNHFFDNPVQVYEYFFSNHKNIYFINTADRKPIEEYEPDNQITDWMHLTDLSIQERESEQTFRIHAVRKLKETRSRHVCPECNSENTMSIIGTKIATLSSITVSQVLSSNLDPRIERERKILAFTNSVQDAAHQAGFVEARNYRFTFRASLQKIINDNSGPICITELQNQFLTYWKKASDATGQKQEDAFFYRFFPTDYHGKADIDVDYRDTARKFTPAFRNEFDLRMRWEVLSEFGYNAQIGRTLEKSGASAVCFDSSRIDAIFPAIRNWLEQNNLSVIGETGFKAFVNGVLHRVRMRGGIDHPYLHKFRNGQLRLWDLNWNRDERHFLNKIFHPRSRFPRLVTTKSHGQGLLDSTYTRNNNWYRSYYLKSFPLAPAYHELVNDFFKKLFEVFVEVGIMNKCGDDDNANYAIVPELIYIQNKVVNHICDTCGSKLSTAAPDSLSGDSHCLSYTCTGVYSMIGKSRPNYYQLVYNRNLSPRIYASEHTGILERKVRENKEIDFKERPRYNSLNTIVATSTLEMGIDIGTLNTAINNSVPPLTSNFLQRVGRAGRSSGSALIANFAQGKAHDLYYYDEPMDMMAGEIATPGCYLEARDILYRHFLAYCLDNWASSEPKKNGIPGCLISLQLSRTDLNAPEFWPNKIVSFIKANEQKLLTEFTEFYKPDMEEHTVLENLKTYLKEEGFYLRLTAIFKGLKEEYVFINHSIRDIEASIKHLPNDAERKGLELEKKALWGLKRLLDKRSVVEHLTNVGFLPNYAFPETGVTLNATVFAGKAKASDNIPSNRQFEIVRSSKSAIRDLAPDNQFYSQGFKFAISGLNTYNWKDAGILIVKRFCSNCDHIADKVISTQSHCPKCGDAAWSSDKNQHVFIRMNAVKSVNFRDKSTLDDNSDDRSLAHYRISRHLQFNKASFQGAWGMKEIPFGIEYIKNVDIIEVNLGLSSAVSANKVIVNQQEDVPYHGFVTCRHCGKSTSKVNQRDYKFHFGYCKYRDSEYKGAKDNVFEEVYLFREIKTEAMKILLPVQEFDSEATVNMFKAGLELGLKKYYKGNPQHLSIINYAEFNAKNSRFDKYLVLYDNIPGGTGYLEKLFSPPEFTEVICKAYAAIRNCICQARGKDGCYRCIYTYSNQFTWSQLSRSRAEQLFKQIVDKSNAWEACTSGLGTLTSSGQIEESELEDRFIRSLRNHILRMGFVFEDFHENGIVNYKFNIKTGDMAYYYVIRPQYDLGLSHSVKLNTRADFFISLSGAEKDGVPIEDDTTLESIKGIAVYLDGYTFHATEENLRFYDDLLKRRAIAESGSIISWTLTWSDIERFDSIQKPIDSQIREQGRDSLCLDKVKYKGSVDAFKRLFGAGFINDPLFSCKNSFERLIWMLTNPLDASTRQKKIGLFLGLFQEQFALPSADSDWIDELLKDSTSVIDQSSQATNKENGNFYVLPDVQIGSNFISTRVGVRIADLSIKSYIFLNVVTGSLQKEDWERFWHLYNLIQEQVEVV